MIPAIATPVFPRPGQWTTLGAMTNTAKFLGLIAALAMFLFSSWMYLQTGDWVAAVFALGSIGYALFFFGRST